MLISLLSLGITPGDQLGHVEDGAATGQLAALGEVCALFSPAPEGRDTHAQQAGCIFGAGGLRCIEVQGSLYASCCDRVKSEIHVELLIAAPPRQRITLASTRKRRLGCVDAC